MGNNREVWLANTKKTVQYTQYYPSGLPWASIASDSTGLQERKYNGKEFVEMHGYDTYDYGARGYYAAMGRFQTVDPLCEKYYWISPYAYCGGNPVNRTDPDGMKWKNQKEDEAYAKIVITAANKKISSKTKTLESQEKQLAKLKANENPNQKKIDNMNSQISETKADISNLNSTVSEISEMGDTNNKQEFTFNQIEGNVGGTEMKDGVITMNVVSISNAVHESSHGYDLFKNGTYNRDNYLNGEIRAYGRQFSFTGELPNSYIGSANSIKAITEKWVLGIQVNNEFIYAKFMMGPAYNYKSVLRILNKK